MTNRIRRTNARNVAVVGMALTVGLLTFSPAFVSAKPPKHAPAHGYRRKQERNNDRERWSPELRRDREELQRRREELQRRREEELRQRREEDQRRWEEERRRREEERRNRDRDRDGVPDYRDRDIDGDGVRNRRDRYDYNRSRYGQAQDRDRDGIRTAVTRTSMGTVSATNGTAIRWTRAADKGHS